MQFENESYEVASIRKCITLGRTKVDRREKQRTEITRFNEFYLHVDFPFDFKCVSNAYSAYVHDTTRPWVHLNVLSIFFKNPLKRVLGQIREHDTKRANLFYRSSRTAAVTAQQSRISASA